VTTLKTDGNLVVGGNTLYLGAAADVSLWLALLVHSPSWLLAFQANLYRTSATQLNTDQNLSTRTDRDDDGRIMVSPLWSAEVGAGTLQLGLDTNLVSAMLSSLPIFSITSAVPVCGRRTQNRRRFDRHRHAEW
jgi:hypothetical protein